MDGEEGDDEDWVIPDIPDEGEELTLRQASICDA